MKIWHISDTHDHHYLLSVPDGIDMVIHSGDFTNFRDPIKNRIEAYNFLNWFSELNIPHKVLIAGNHDAFADTSNSIFREECKTRGIVYLEHEMVTINDVKIFGSPYTPTFGNWYFMKNRNKLDRTWSQVSDDVDIFVVHGPPKGILDTTITRENRLELCGCSSLRKHILNRIKPRFVMFGHIHNVKDIVNAGYIKLSTHDTIFSNGSVVTDREFGKVTSNGNIFNYESSN